jgi:hypothetical protein
VNNLKKIILSFFGVLFSVSIVFACQVAMTQLDHYLQDVKNVTNFFNESDIVVTAAVVKKNDLAFVLQKEEACGEAKIQDGFNQWSYEIEIKDVISGIAPKGVSYAEWRLNTYASCNRGSIMIACPQLMGSGLESEMEEGKEYVLWLMPLVGIDTPLRGAFLIQRVDDINKKAKIQEFLKNLK